MNEWADAFNAAGASGASDSDRAAYAAAGARLQAALMSAKDVVGGDVPTCGIEAQARAKSFVDLLDQGLKDILTSDSVDLGQLAVAGALIEQAAEIAPTVGEAINDACLN